MDIIKVSTRICSLITVIGIFQIAAGNDIIMSSVPPGFGPLRINSSMMKDSAAFQNYACPIILKMKDHIPLKRHTWVTYRICSLYQLT
ncbi:hypothetical protein PGB90_001101 [Kerria lacca]